MPLAQTNLSHFSAAALNGPADKFCCAFAAGTVDILGKFAAGCVHFAQGQENLIGAGIEMPGDISLQLAHQGLRFLARGNGVLRQLIRMDLLGVAFFRHALKRLQTAHKIRQQRSADDHVDGGAVQHQQHGQQYQYEFAYPFLFHRTYFMLRIGLMQL